jgi:hypothetical protein
MFTVARLGIDGRLAKTLTTSNPIKSMISIARTTNRNVTRWRDGQMVLRWTAAGMLNAERSFRHIKGHKQMPARRRPPPTRPPPHRRRRRICRCRRIEFTVDRHRKSTRTGTRSAVLTGRFQNTLRVPDDGTIYGLPSAPDRLPLRRVADLPKRRVPQRWMASGGVVMPMRQSQACWLALSRPEPIGLGYARNDVSGSTA